MSPSGKAGSLKVTLPKGDVVSGHWACGTKQRTGPPSRPALAPATVPPVVNERAIGTLNTPTPPPPVSCADGDLNVAAWEGDTALTRAGRSASLALVEADICSDYKLLVKGGTNPDSATMVRNYGIAALYYGWKFSPTPPRWWPMPAASLEPSAPLLPEVMDPARPREGHGHPDQGDGLSPRFDGLTDGLRVGRKWTVVVSPELRRGEPTGRFELPTRCLQSSGGGYHASYPLNSARCVCAAYGSRASPAGAAR